MVRPQLPDFQHPPVIEVALSIQFEELTNLHAVHLGLLWKELGTEVFPRTEEHPPIPANFERFGVPSPVEAPQIEFLNVPPMPRCLFISEKGGDIVQVQNDRFTFNWRKRSENDAYPRFEAIVERFEFHFGKFQEFLEREKLGSVEINQAEVTYVNRIEIQDLPGQAEKIISAYSGEFSDKFLPHPEEIYLSLRFPIKRDDHMLGRLYVDLRPSIPGVPESARTMTLLARGKPESSDIKDSYRFFEVARQHIVSGFASVTSAEMHKVWERTDNA